MSLKVARVQEIRWQVLHLLDSERPNLVSEGILRRGLTGIQASPDEIRKELLYLKQREMVRIETRNDTLFACLVAAGVDFLEGQSSSLPGLQKLEAGLSKLELERRKELRWRLLRAVDISRPQALNEALAQRVMHDAAFPVTSAELRRVAVYLEQKGLLAIDQKNPECWLFALTADGVDVCEYSVDCPKGIGRPEKYWS